MQFRRDKWIRHPAALMLLATGLVGLGYQPLARAQDAGSEEAEEAEQTPPGASNEEQSATLTAEQHYEKAVANFEERRWDEAAVHFSAALEMDPNAILAFNTGRAFEYTGDLASAERYYLEALKLRPPEELRSRLYATLERVANLRERVADKADELGLLEVVTSPPGATVLVNGAPVGTTPFQAAHPIGTFTVAAVLDGHTELNREVEIKPGREVVLNATLVEETRILTWVSAGLGLALIGGGVWLGIEAQSTLDELDSVNAKRRNEASFDRLKSDGESLALGSVILYTAGALSLASSIAFFFIEAPETPPVTSEPGGLGSVELIVAPSFIGVGGEF